MAAGNSFAALSRHSKTGASPTLGRDIPEMAPHLSIGAVEDTDEDALSVPVPKTSPFSRLARTAPPEFTGREYAEPNKTEEQKAANPFVALARAPADPEQSPQVRMARKDIQAVKVLTQLVRGMAFHPGCQATNAVKSAALRSHIVATHTIGRSLAQGVTSSQEPSEWAVGQCCEVVAGMMSKRLEACGPDRLAEETQEQTQTILRVLRELQDDVPLAACVDALGATEYVAVTDSGIAKDRLAISLASAIWELHEVVQRNEFRYGFDTLEIVNALAEPLMPTVMQSNIRITDQDLQIAHLQGSVRRLAMLIGAAYSAQTRKIQQWIAEGERSGDAGRREEAAHRQLLDQVVPSIHTVAKRNFLSIEQLAPRMLQDVSMEHSGPSENTWRGVFKSKDVNGAGHSQTYSPN